MDMKFLRNVSLVVLLGAAGCTTTTNSATNQCQVDSTVTCASGSTGYTCTAGAAAPDVSDTSLVCGASNGADQYCCTTATTTTQCALTTQSCTGGQVYTCPATVAAPDVSDTSITCGTPVSDNGMYDYCCVPATTYDCQLDYTVTQGCASGTYGYSCTPDSPPPDYSVSSIVCSIPAVTSTADDYCCATLSATSSSTCSQDSSVTGCQDGSFGFSCTGTDTPDQSYSTDLSCSDGVVGQDAFGNDATLYCCLYSSSSTTPSSCVPDSTVTCNGGAAGYTCLQGDPSPEAADSSLTCSDPTTQNGFDMYCCT
jgi:hypothetical protein